MLPKIAVGASVMGEMPWGTHFCYFYETKQDLLETAVAFFQAGLEDGAFCFWIVYDPVTESDARQALAESIAGADHHLAQGAIQLFVHPEPEGEPPDPREMICFLHQKLYAALAQGYTGMRVAGSPACLQKTHRQQFREFEQELGNFVSGRRMISLCNFPLGDSSAAEILDAARTHQFVLAKRSGHWEIIETPEPKLTKAQLAKLNQQLEERVEERTQALEEANERLRAEIARREQVEKDLRQQKEILQTVFDHAPVAISFLDNMGRFRMVNPEWERMAGFSWDEVVNQGVDVIAEACPDPVERERARDFIANSASKWEDFELRAKDGRTLQSTWSVVRLSDGSRIGIGQDIVQRKQAEQELRGQKEVLQTIFDHVPVMINFGNEQLGLRLVNRQWEETLGWSLEEIRREKIDVLVENYPDPEYRAQVLDFVNNTVGEWRDFKTKVRDGRVIDTSWMMLQLPNGTGLGIGQDITERKRTEERLKTSSEQLRALSASLQSAREKEAARIARQIHDDLGGVLTGLRWELEAVHKMLREPPGAKTLQTIRQKLAGMVGFTDTTIDVVRRIASELRPSILDDLGLPEAIEWQAQQFQSRTGIQCRCDCSIQSLPLGDEQSTAVFRIVQEALTNVLRHAQATQVDITMRQDAGMFDLTVRDNGRGITQAEKANRNSLGLLGMQERAHLIGAEFEITGESGSGARLHLRVPISGHENVRGAL